MLNNRTSQQATDSSFKSVSGHQSNKNNSYIVNMVWILSAREKKD